MLWEAKDVSHYLICAPCRNFCSILTLASAFLCAMKDVIS